MRNRWFILLACLLAVGTSSDMMAQKKKSASKAIQKYAQYVSDKAQGKEKKAVKGASDPATVTRDSVTLENDASYDPLRAEYEQFRQKSITEYEDFRRKANREYAEFIKKAWQEFGAKPAVPKPKEEEKPPVVIKEKEIVEPVKDVPVPIKETITPPAPEPQPKPVAPIREQPVPAEKWQAFSVYGTDMKVRFDDSQIFSLPSCTNEAVSAAWQKLSDKKYDNLIRDCLTIRMTNQLSDWAYLNMLHRMAEACLGKGNAATLLMAFIYCQSGYQMRLATANGTLRMLYATKHSIYDKSYFWIDGDDYYVFDGNENSLQVCNVNFPQEKALSLNIREPQKFAMSKSDTRTLTSARYPDMEIEVSVNKNLVDFFNEYPSSYTDRNFMTRWALYANTPLDQAVKDALYPALTSKINGLTKKEAVDRLLNWVQTAFVYGYDDKIWGGDRAFFAEETLFYPYCDCEDRSILFSRLVRDLVGLKVILVYYPGHLASAVCFDTDVKGDYIQLNDDKFTICDATYIGAPLGRTMPGMNNEKATVILLNQ